MGLCPIPVHDVALCDPLFKTATVLRAGDLVLEDRGFVDGETITSLKQQRQVGVIVPLKSSMLSYQEAVQLAELQGEWQPHLSRKKQHILTVVLSYSLYHLFANTQAGARFADKTREALAFAQLRSRRTHVIVYARGYFAIFETLSFVQLVLKLPPFAQHRLRYWLDEHLHMVAQRK